MEVQGSQRRDAHRLAFKKTDIDENSAVLYEAVRIPKGYDNPFDDDYRLFRVGTDTWNSKAWGGWEAGQYYVKEEDIVWVRSDDKIVLWDNETGTYIPRGQPMKPTKIYKNVMGSTNLYGGVHRLDTNTTRHILVPGIGIKGAVRDWDQDWNRKGDRPLDDMVRFSDGGFYGHNALGDQTILGQMRALGGGIDEYKKKRGISDDYYGLKPVQPVEPVELDPVPEAVAPVAPPNPPPTFLINGQTYTKVTMPDNDEAEYSDMSYEGVDYVILNGRVSNENFEIMGEWKGDHIKFSSPEAEVRHLEDMAEEDIGLFGFTEEDRLIPYGEHVAVAPVAPIVPVAPPVAVAPVAPPVPVPVPVPVPAPVAPVAVAVGDFTVHQKTWQAKGIWKNAKNFKNFNAMLGKEGGRSMPNPKAIRLAKEHALADPLIKGFNYNSFTKRSEFLKEIDRDEWHDPGNPFSEGTGGSGKEEHMTLYVKN